MSTQEHYDPSKPVCDNQADFNKAFHKALEHNNRENYKKSKPWMYVSVLLWVIFFVWALMLAMKVTPGPERQVHLVFAMIFSPVYVLSYYLGMMQQE